MHQVSESSVHPLKIAYLTAGGAGMFCGSCMRDNTVARAMSRMGHDVHLIPMYTPIRVDEEDVSEQTLFYGGINVYMEQNVPGYRFLPEFLIRWLDQRWIIQWATSRGMETDARQLGAMTVSMLQGEKGNQRTEARRLANYLADSLQPQVVNLSNMLVAGVVPLIKRKINCPVIVTLQGDDIFMDDLPEPWRTRSLDLIRDLVPQIDAFVVFSRYYADYMAEYFDIPQDKFRFVSLGIDLHDLPDPPSQAQHNEGRPLAVGYLARMVPEKGLHILVDAFLHLRTLPGMDQVRLKLAGWAGKQQQAFVDEQMRKLAEANCAEFCDYYGTIDRGGKLEFLRGIDVLSVPTTYKEPKGLFVLEALAAGVPVVQPSHGAFPELISATGGGHLVPPHDPIALADKLAELLLEIDATRQLGRDCAERIRRDFTSEVAARETLEIYARLLERVPESAEPNLRRFA